MSHKYFTLLFLDTDLNMKTNPMFVSYSVEKQDDDDDSDVKALVYSKSANNMPDAFVQGLADTIQPDLILSSAKLKSLAKSPIPFLSIKKDFSFDDLQKNAKVQYKNFKEQPFWSTTLLAIADQSFNTFESKIDKKGMLKRTSYTLAGQIALFMHAKEKGLPNLQKRFRKTYSDLSTLRTKKFFEPTNVPSNSLIDVSYNLETKVQN